MIKYHDCEQGSEEWLEVRRGVISASNMKLLLTPKLEIANNDKERSHVYELAAQRISKFVEMSYVSDDMERGKVDEIRAKAKYSEVYKKKIHDIGFITNDKFGFTMGVSPDGIVIGESTYIECKSRLQKYQLETITNYEIPIEFIAQVQTGLMVGEFEKCHFISYSGGWPMATIEIYPDKKIQEVIFQACYKYEKRIRKVIEEYERRIQLMPNAFIPTERVLEPKEIINE